jgi:hypothetical protein
MNNKLQTKKIELFSTLRQSKVLTISCFSSLIIFSSGCDSNKAEFQQLQSKLTTLQQFQAEMNQKNSKLKSNNDHLKGFIESQKMTIEGLNSTNAILLQKFHSITPISCNSNAGDIKGLRDKIEKLTTVCHSQIKPLDQSIKDKKQAVQNTLPSTKTTPVKHSTSPLVIIPDQRPTPTPCETGLNTACDNGKTADIKNSSGDEQRQLMMMAAFVACNYYSAGTCAFFTSALSLNFGISGEDVKQEMQTTWDNASNELRNKQFKIPGPDGKPMTLSVNSAQKGLEAIQAVQKMPVNEQQNVCKVLITLQKTELGKEFQLGQIKAYGFPSQINKDNVLKILKSISPAMADQLNKFPVKGQGQLPC